jgi:hypothetical protein
VIAGFASIAHQHDILCVVQFADRAQVKLFFFLLWVFCHPRSRVKISDLFLVPDFV